MRVKISKHTAPKEVSRIKKKLRIRKRLEGSTERPRLSLFRSSRHYYVQIIDDTNGSTLVALSTFDWKKPANKETAQKLGAELAMRAIEKNITTVVFDRNGYLYHGRVKAFADAAREAGLKF